MNSHNKYLTNSGDSKYIQKQYLSIPISSNFKINSRFKRKKFNLNTPLLSNFSQSINSNNRNMQCLTFKSTSSNISHRDFHKNVHLQNYSQRHFNNYSKYGFMNNKSLYNKYASNSSIEKDLNMMKMKMSCDLITYKINQIKNKVQDLQESSRNEDKALLNKNKDYISCSEIFNISKNNQNSFIDNYSGKSYNSLNLHKIQNLKIIDNTINGLSNEDQFNINNFRKNIYDKVPFLKQNNNPKFHPNKNALKYILLNSHNPSIPIINNSYNNSNNRKLLTDKNEKYIKINQNLKLLNDKIIESYTNKNNTLLTEQIGEKRFKKQNIYNINKKNNINNNNGQKRDTGRNKRKLLKDNSNSSKEIRYGSFDKYFLKNNFEEDFLSKNSKNSNREIYNKNYNYNNVKSGFDSKDKMEQIKKINKMLNKNSINNENKNDMNTYEKNSVRLKDNIPKNNNISTLSKQNNSLKRYLKYNKNKNSNYTNFNDEKNKLQIKKGINNFNYYVNKEGNIVQNNYINNNFNLDKTKKKDTNSQTKGYNNPILSINKRNEVSQNKAKINSAKIKTNNKVIDRNFKSNINYNSKFFIQNNSLDLYNYNKNNSLKENDNKEENQQIKIDDKNINFNEFLINNKVNANNEISKDQINLRNNYSKDDVLRYSERINSNDKENNNIEKKEENIFNLMIQEKEKEETKKNHNEKIKNNENTTDKINNNLNKKIVNQKLYLDKKNYNRKIMNNNKTIKYKIQLDNNKNVNNNIIENKNKFNKNPNINIQKIIKYKEKTMRPKHKELCHKFTDNPQHFFTIKLNDLMLKALNLKRSKNFELK